MTSILSKNTDRFVIFPIEKKLVWDMYKKHVASFWTAEEIDFTQDITDWPSLSSDEQHFIKMVLAFFAASDGIVIENLALRFLGEVQDSEIRCFYGFQLMMENIHSETYSLSIDTLLGGDEKEKSRLFNAIDNFPCVKEKADWALSYLDAEKCDFGTRLIAFACVEGIFFSGAFCALFWLKKRNLMHGLTFSNELISRDEGLHRDFATLLHNSFLQPEEKCPDEKIIEIVKYAVTIEKKFILESLPVNLIGMNCALMSQYIEFVADHLLSELNIPKTFNVNNPFPWMGMISLQGKTNFFERRVSEYQKASIATTFEFEADF